MPEDLPETSQNTRFRCRHIFTDGRRCGSPCLRREPFCYFHHTHRKPAPDPRTHPRTAPGAQPASRDAFTLSVPEDRASIQVAIGEILARIADGSIDLRRAGLLLYGLQIAAGVMPLYVAPPTGPEPLVVDITVEPEFGALAPPSEYRPPRLTPDQEFQLRHAGAAVASF